MSNYCAFPDMIQRNGKTQIDLLKQFNFLKTQLKLKCKNAEINPYLSKFQRCLINSFKQKKDGFIQKDITEIQDLDSFDKPFSDQQSNESSYSFLRNIWGSNFYQRNRSHENNQDQLDKINKIVGMMKTRVNFMTRKQNFLYEKQQAINKKKYDQSKNSTMSENQNSMIGNQFVYQNSIFQKLKQDMENTKMQNEQYALTIKNHEKTIAQLKSQNLRLQQAYHNLKKKSKQNQTNFIRVSQKNIELQKNYLKSKKDEKQKGRKTTQLQNSYISSNMDLAFSSNIQRDSESSIGNRKMVNDNDNGKTSLRNAEQIDQLLSNFQFANVKSLNCLGDVTEKHCNLNQKEKRQNSNCQQNQNLKFSQSPMKFRYIKYQQESGRKSLLSSVRSVDLQDNKSVNKLKFQRTSGLPNQVIKKSSCHLGAFRDKLFKADGKGTQQNKK